MSRGVFVTATGTDVGKTYISALIVKMLRENGVNCGYYKAAISGAETIEKSDAGYVNQIANIGQEENSLLSYLYTTPVSPHLAANIEGNAVELTKIKEDYNRVCDTYDFVLTEGSGGIVCPIRYDEEQKIMLEDIIRILDTPVLIIASAGLGTINSTVLTVAYLQQKGFKVNGIILNCFEDSLMHRDNLKMIEALTGINVVAAVKKGDKTLDIELNTLQALFE